MGFAEDFLEKERVRSGFKLNSYDYDKLGYNSEALKSEKIAIESNKTITDTNNFVNHLKPNSSNDIIQNKKSSKFKDNNHTGFVREIAHRLFAAELKESNLQSKEGQDDQYPKQYLITPTGAKANRVFIVGTLTEKEDVGTASEFWRGRIVDPTGTFYVTAGQYHPEAVQVLAKTLPPEFIAVIGKPTTFTTKEGNVLTSIRAESMHVVDAATRDRWVVETANLTAKRLAKLQGNEPDVVKAREYYSTDVEQYKTMVEMAIRSRAR